MEGVDFNAPVKFYTHQIDEMIRAEKGALFVDYKHLTTFRWNDQTFLDNLFSEYSRFEPYLRKAILQFVQIGGHPIKPTTIYQLGIYNTGKVEKIRELKTSNLGRLISIDGTVTRTTEVKPELQLGTFKCEQCN